VAGAFRLFVFRLSFGLPWGAPTDGEDAVMSPICQWVGSAALGIETASGFYRGKRSIGCRFDGIQALTIQVCNGMKFL
jgi:hypothetical protein